MFLLFFRWIPWVVSVPIAYVPSEVAAQMPAACPAVFTNHGHHSCFWPGLIRDHLGTFIALTGALFGCSALLIVTGYIGHGFSFRKRKVS
jgi:hypothetical protein